MKLAKRKLTSLKIEAKSLKKVVEERDLLAEKLREMEMKYAALALVAGGTGALSTHVTPIKASSDAQISVNAALFSAPHNGQLPASSGVSSSLTTTAVCVIDNPSVGSGILVTSFDLEQELGAKEARKQQSLQGDDLSPALSISLSSPQQGGAAPTPFNSPFLKSHNGHHLPDNNSNISVVSGSNKADAVEAVVSQEDYLKLKRELEVAKTLLTKSTHSTPSSNHAHPSLPSNTAGIGASLTPTRSMGQLLHHKTIASSSSSSVAPSIDTLIREQKKAEQLLSTMNELDRYKKRINQLEEENRRLAMKPSSLSSASTVGVGGAGGLLTSSSSFRVMKIDEMTPPRQQSGVGASEEELLAGHDSDDSIDDDDPEDLIEELENRRSDWKEYLKSFAEGDGDEDESFLAKQESNDSDDEGEDGRKVTQQRWRGDSEVDEEDDSERDDEGEEEQEPAVVNIKKNKKEKQLTTVSGKNGEAHPSKPHHVKEKRNSINPMKLMMANSSSSPANGRAALSTTAIPSSSSLLKPRNMLASFDEKEEDEDDEDSEEEGNGEVKKAKNKTDLNGERQGGEGTELDDDHAVNTLKGMNSLDTGDEMNMEKLYPDDDEDEQKNGERNGRIQGNNAMIERGRKQQIIQKAKKNDYYASSSDSSEEEEDEKEEKTSRRASLRQILSKKNSVKEGEETAVVNKEEEGEGGESTNSANNNDLKRFQLHRKASGKFEEVSPLYNNASGNSNGNANGKQLRWNSNEINEFDSTQPPSLKVPSVQAGKEEDGDEIEGENGARTSRDQRSEHPSSTLFHSNTNDSSVGQFIIESAETTDWTPVEGEDSSPLLERSSASQRRLSTLSTTTIANPEESLFELISANDIDELQGLLANFPRVVRTVNHEGLSALHLACSLNSLPLVSLLLSYNFPVDVVDDHGRTPLHHCHSSEIVGLLCEDNADVDAVDSLGLTPLLVYVLEENIDCVRILLSYGANPNIPEPIHQRTVLHLAALSMNYELLAVVITESLHIPVTIDLTDLEGNSSLLLIANSDRYPLSMQNTSGKHSGNTAVATPASVTTDGETPSSVSSSTLAIKEPWKLLMLLLDKGSSIQLSNEKGITVLHYLCANRYFSRFNRLEPLIELLLEMGADPNAHDSDGCTPLIIAVAYREWNISKLLLDAGGDLNIPCNMNSAFLQLGIGSTVNHPLNAESHLITSSSSKHPSDQKTKEILNTADCTASDLMPKSPRYRLFASIKVLQTRIPGETRDRCMNCGNNFIQSSSFFRSMISSGKHHCRYCHRVVCQDCSPHEVSRSKFPIFVRECYHEASLRACIVCETILTSDDKS
jgi:ankyrin repeat protein